MHVITQDSYYQSQQASVHSYKAICGASKPGQFVFLLDMDGSLINDLHKLVKCPCCLNYIGRSKDNGRDRREDYPF